MPERQGWRPDWLRELTMPAGAGRWSTMAQMAEEYPRDAMRARPAVWRRGHGPWNRCPIPQVFAKDILDVLLRKHMKTTNQCYGNTATLTE
jgi:hypothetical protein